MRNHLNGKSRNKNHITIFDINKYISTLDIEIVFPIMFNLIHLMRLSMKSRKRRSCRKKVDDF